MGEEGTYERVSVSIPKGEATNDSMKNKFLGYVSQFQSPKGRLQTKRLQNPFRNSKGGFNPQRGGYKQESWL